MIIVISPAKKLDFKSIAPTQKHTTPAFLDKSAILIEELRKFSPSDLAILMNISSDIANFAFERYSQWRTPFDTGNAKQAVFAFNGDVYRSMGTDDFSDDDIDYAQNHLRIISGLYGLLRPLDLIQPYRLEMGIKFRIAGDKNLYQFWSNTITMAINELIENDNQKVLVNLASNEYFKAVDTGRLKGKVVSPVFREYRDGMFKSVGILAKRARGLMTRHIIKNKLADIEEIKLFNPNGYAYTEDLSTEHEWVFTR